MIILDTSAAIAALTAHPRSEELVKRLVDDGDLHAPHLIDVEVSQALRGLVSRGELSTDRAEDVRLDFDELLITRYPHQPLADRMWTLRHNLTAYDAAFVSLAEVLGAPLITCDGHIARSPGHGAKVELFGEKQAFKR